MTAKKVRKGFTIGTMRATHGARMFASMIDYECTVCSAVRRTTTQDLKNDVARGHGCRVCMKIDRETRKVWARREREAAAKLRCDTRNSPIVTPTTELDDEIDPDRRQRERWYMTPSEEDLLRAEERITRRRMLRVKLRKRLEEPWCRFEDAVKAIENCRSLD